MYTQIPGLQQLQLAHAAGQFTSNIYSAVPGVPAFGALSSGGARWGGGVCAPNGNIYFPPARSGALWGKVTPGGTFTYNIGLVNTTSNGFFSAALATDGKIYAAPYVSAAGVNILDPVTETSTFNTYGLNMADDGKWLGTVLGVNKKLYGIPGNSTTVLVIDTVTGTAERKDYGLNLSGANKWSSGVLAPNGKIYCIPLESTDILIIDTVTDTATLSSMGANLAGASKWYGGTLGADGKIYGIPYSVTDILIIDPVIGVATRSNMGANLTATSKWVGGLTAANGKIYGCPYGATNILEIDPINQSARLVTDSGIVLSGVGKYWGGATNLLGDVYMCPSYAANTLCIKNSHGIAMPKINTIGPLNKTAY
jgi:hypothetical protein